ncbi:spore germination protein GerPE [Halalkalibacter okhensis]|nr:spore germination protein GerPE [Halalkalibacter okhensis]
MLKRMSFIDAIKVNNVGLSSILEIGDSYSIKPRTKALAIQRQLEYFYGDEGHFKDPVFTRPLPQPTFDEPIRFVRYNESPCIKVNNISVTAIAASSVMHIGSTTCIESDSRVKNVRQLARTLEDTSD